MTILPSKRKRRQPVRFDSPSSGISTPIANCSGLLSSKISLLRAATHNLLDPNDVYGAQSHKNCLLDFGSTKCEVGWATEPGAPVGAVNYVPFPADDGRPYLPAYVQYVDGKAIAHGWEVDQEKQFTKYFKLAFWGDNPYEIDPEQDCNIPPELTPWDVCKHHMEYIYKHVRKDYEKCGDMSLPLAFVLTVSETLEQKGVEALLKACRDAGMKINAPVIAEHAAAALGGLALTRFEPGYRMVIDSGGGSVDIVTTDVRRSKQNPDTFLVVPYGKSFSKKAGGLRVDQRFAALLRDTNPGMNAAEVRKATENFSKNQKTVWPAASPLDPSITSPPTMEQLRREVFEPEFTAIIETFIMAVKDFVRQRKYDEEVYQMMKKLHTTKYKALMARVNKAEKEDRTAITKEAEEIQMNRLPRIDSQLNRLNDKLHIVLMGGFGQSAELLDKLRNLECLEGLVHELKTPLVQFAHGVFHGACFAVGGGARFVTIKPHYTYAIWGYHDVEGVPRKWQKGRVHEDKHIGANTVLSPELIWEQETSVGVGKWPFILGKVAEADRRPTFPRFIRLRRMRTEVDAPPPAWEDVMVLDMDPLHQANRQLRSSTSNDTGVDGKDYQVLEYQVHMVYGDQQIMHLSVTDPTGTIVFKQARKVLLDF